MAERSLTIRIQLDDRNHGQEESLLAKVRETLAEITGEPRPRLEVGRAEQGEVPNAGDDD